MRWMVEASQLRTTISALLDGLLWRPQAYLDPGSGSYLLQLLIAGVLGAALVLRMYWARVKGFFRKLFGKGEDEQHEQQ